MMAALAPVSARLVEAFGTKLVVVGGMTLLAAGLLWAASLGDGSTYSDFLPTMMVMGGGVALTWAPATEAIMGAIPPSRQASDQPSTTPFVKSAVHSASPFSAAWSPDGSPHTSNPARPHFRGQHVRPPLTPSAGRFESHNNNSTNPLPVSSPRPHARHS